MGTSRYRKKESIKGPFGGREYCSYNPAWLDRTHSCQIVSGQETWDNKNGWRGGSSPSWDQGGDFTTKIWEYSPSSCFVDWTGPAPLWYKYRGNLLPEDLSTYNWGSSSPWATETAVNPSGEDTLIQLGASAISRVAPTNPHASASVALGELKRDGLPALPGLTAAARGGRPSALAGEYLNSEFGIRPLISDLKKLANAVSKSEKILSQYYRDSGRSIRRRYSFPSTTETRQFRKRHDVSPWPILMSDLWSYAYGNVDVTVYSTKETWFSGAFTYFAKPPSGFSDFRAYAQEANHLLGLGITPSVVYDLTPWSWAADWFTNLGDVLNNISMMQTDGLVLRHGYIMERFTNRAVVTWSGGTARDGSKPAPTHELKYEFKRRRRATPFGFGLLAKDFTPRQWAIIAALGISRGGEYHALSR